MIYYKKIGCLNMENTIFLTSLSGDEKFNVIYLLILLVFIGSSLIVRFKDTPLNFLKGISTWVIIILSIVLLYSYRFEFSDIKNRLVGELNPSLATKSSQGSIDFRISRDGHFHISASINRYPIEFLLDTGASDVVITRNDAKSIGIDLESLNFNKVYNTANGQTYGAPIVINNLRIGDLVVNNIRASVNNAHMDKSLLGMSFLEKLDGYEVREGVLRLWP